MYIYLLNCVLNVDYVFILLIIIGFYTFSFIKNNLYLDKGLEMKKSVGKTENIAFLNKYGTLGTFINNDIRLIKRSKAARSALIGGVLFLFCAGKAPIVRIFNTRTHKTARSGTPRAVVFQILNPTSF